jgi:two-component system OmpR family sensor kinase
MPLSLRARLIAGMVFVAVVLLVVSAVVTITTRAQLISQVDTRLDSLAIRVRDEERFDAPEDAPFPPDDAPFPVGPRERVSDVYEGFVDGSGTLRDVFRPNAGDYGAPDVDAADLPRDGSAFLTVDAVDGDATYRVLARSVGGGVAITAVPIDDVEQTIERLVLVEVLGALVILAALGVVGWWVIHLGIRPIKDMTDSAERIADGDLAVRIEPGAPGTEAGQLAGALNQMLGTIEHALDEQAASEARLRRFVADASHELRTPVTTIRGYAELYRHGGLGDPEQLADAMRRTEQEAARMGRLVEDMLTLAKLDERRPLVTAPIDLAAIGADAARDARAVAPDRTIQFIADGDAVVTADDDRIRQVVANVVGNALVHTEPGVPITIDVRGDGRTSSIAIRDEGDGMTADVAERVTERFFRADPARSRHRGGSGLGLSIVDATVAAHGGSVDIASEPGVGTTVTLRFPNAGAHSP